MIYFKSKNWVGVFNPNVTVCMFKWVELPTDKHFKKKVFFKILSAIEIDKEMHILLWKQMF